MADSGDNSGAPSGIKGAMAKLEAKMHNSKLHDLQVKATHIKEELGKFHNLINSNHRHDEEHEKRTDRKRDAISKQHRFESFAPERMGNKIKWYIDARDYFWALSEALERAKETIYLADWWISPELFLRRPPYEHMHWRLDKILKRKAEQGVKIYVMVYKEIEAAISCNSAHTKTALRALCPPGSPGHGNITVMRHPDHNVFENAGDMTFYWAHHEKFVVIDYDIAFIGGLDLCFGRWDTKQHPLADVSPRGVELMMFPGQDYNNNRIMDFKSVGDWKNNELSKADFGRMPWHDVHMGVIGPSVYDIAEHFVLRWNFCKRDKYKRDKRFDWLLLEGREGEDEDLVGVQRPKFPVGEYIKHPLSPLSTKPVTPDQGTIKAQIVRSSADWSSGILPEYSIQNAYKELIRNAKHFVYIENQFFITATGDQQKPIQNTIGEAIVDAVVSAAKENRKFRVIVVIPAIPGFAGDLRVNAAAGTRAIMDYQYKSINRGEHSIYGRVKAAGYDPEKYIFFFNLRSYDRINKTPALQEMEQLSGVKYQEVQRAMAEEIMGEAVHGVSRADPEDSPSEEHDHKGDEEKAAALAARDKFFAQKDKVARSKFNDVDGDLIADSADTIAKSAMLGEPKPSQEMWNKDDPQSETENFIQEELYVHDKLLIIDDRIVLCGSSNINDRSQLGIHDSELSIVMEDTDMMDSYMDGKEYKAGRHATTLRRMLWREHLGLLPAQDVDASKDPNAQPPDVSPNDFDEKSEWNGFVADPLGDKVWDLWTKQATTNTEVFRHLFHADPDSNIKTFKDYDAFLPRQNKTKQGHLYDPYSAPEDVKADLDKIRGHLVWMPLDFLCNAEMAEKGLQINEFTESVYT